MGRLGEKMHRRSAVNLAKDEDETVWIKNSENEKGTIMKNNDYVHEHLTFTR